MLWIAQRGQPIDKECLVLGENAMEHISTGLCRILVPVTAQHDTKCSLQAYMRLPVSQYVLMDVSLLTTAFRHGMVISLACYLAAAAS